MSELVAGLTRDPDAENAGWIAVIDSAAAGKCVREREARIARSISAFEPADGLWASGLDPRVFEANGSLDVPCVLWHLDTGEWVGVSRAAVGYGGPDAR